MLRSRCLGDGGRRECLVFNTGGRLACRPAFRLRSPARPYRRRYVNRHAIRRRHRHPLTVLIAIGRMRPMPIARSSFQAVAVAGRIVVVGGEGSGTTFGRVDSLDPASGRWTRLADLPHPRHGLGLIANGAFVYAIEGGPQAGLTTSNTVEALRVG